MSGEIPFLWKPDEIRTSDDAKHERAAKVFGLGLVGITVLTATFAVYDKWANRVTYPKVWDPRVVDITTEVEKLRELKFRRPVHVLSVPEAKFDAALADSDKVWEDASGNESKYTFVCTDSFNGDWGSCKGLGGVEIDPAAEVLKIIGVTDSEGQVSGMPLSVDNATVLARYNDKRKRIEIRGPIEKVPKSLIAHELVHVLQDQHFGFDCDCHSFDEWLGFRSLTEGDAERIEAQYTAAQSPKEAESDAEANRQIGFDVQERVTETIEEEEISEDLVDLQLELGAFPYEAGREFVEEVVRRGGSTALDKLYAQPPRSSAEILRLKANAKRVKIKPAPFNGKKYTTRPIAIGAWYWRESLRNYDLGLHIDAITNAWQAEAANVYESSLKQVCFASRIALTGNDVAKAALAYEELAAKIPNGTFRAEMKSEPPTVVVGGCQVGAKKFPADAERNRPSIGECLTLSDDEQLDCLRKSRPDLSVPRTAPSGPGTETESCFLAGTPEKEAECLRKKGKS